MEYLGDSKPINSIEPLVSVCVPTFQHEKFIEECLASILNQKTDFPYEILIGEDDSTDQTRKICEKLAAENQDKIRLFLRRKEDKIRLFGRLSGRPNHLGLYQSARGKYVCICDGDDFWTDDFKLQKQKNILDNCPQVSMCISNYTVNGKEQEICSMGETKILTIKELRSTNYLGHISSWMMRNKMKEFLQNPITKKSVPLDRALFIFNKLRGDIALIPDYTSNYRVHPGGVYQGRSRERNNRALYKNNWYLYYYIDGDLFQFMRSTQYTLRRDFAIFFSKIFKKNGS